MKKKNPQDATLRNINALKKKVRNIEIHIESLHDVITGILAVLDVVCVKKGKKR